MGEAPKSWTGNHENITPEELYLQGQEYVQHYLPEGSERLREVAMSVLNGGEIDLKNQNYLSRLIEQAGLNEQEKEDFMGFVRQLQIDRGWASEKSPDSAEGREDITVESGVGVDQAWPEEAESAPEGLEREPLSPEEALEQFEQGAFVEEVSDFANRLKEARSDLDSSPKLDSEVQQQFMGELMSIIEKYALEIYDPESGKIVKGIPYEVNRGGNMVVGIKSVEEFRIGLGSGVGGDFRQNNIAAISILPGFKKSFREELEENLFL